MQGIATRLGHQVDKTAAHSSVLSVEGICHHLELLHGLHADSVVHLQVGGCQFDGGTVHENVCAGLLAAIELEAALFCRGVRHHSGKPRRYRHELQRIAGLSAEKEREVFNQFARHRRADIGRLRLQLQSIAVYGDRLCGRTNLQHRIHCSRAAHVHSNSILRVRLEPRRTDCEGVSPGLEFRECEQALAARLCVVATSCICLRQFEGSV